MESTNNKKFWLFSEKAAKVMSIVGLAVILISIIWFITCRGWNFSTTINEEKVGQFGDFIGGVVGSILAFAGVILYYVALNAQREDIKINKEALTTQVEALNQQIKEFQAQTEELQETRKVYEEQTNLYREQTGFYKKQVEELSEQTNISKLEQFDSSYFSLLNVFISFKEKNIKRIIDIYSKLIEKRTAPTYDSKKMLNYYMEIYNNNSSFLSQYFKTIYMILSIIENSSIDSAKKIQYAKILRSQLTEEELLIQFYNYQSEYGLKARSYIIKYDMLKHLNPLEKIEYHITDNQIRNQLAPFIQRLFVIIKSNVKKYADIEDGSDIIISEKEILFQEEIVYKLIMKDEFFSYSIGFSQDDKHKEILDNITTVKDVIKKALYDIFFTSKYDLDFQDNTFVEKESTTTEGKSSTKEFTFNANIDKILR